ncbi:MAG: MFS transporter [Patescibacteria group bacterium]
MPLNHNTKLSSHHLINPVETRISEAAALYLTEGIRAFALALIGVFLPIFIYETSFGYTWFHTDNTLNGIAWILIYFFFRSLSTLAITLWFSKLIFTKINFHRSIFISFIALILIIVCWLLAENDIRWLFLASCLTGVTIVFYWIPFHIFSINKLKEDDGQYGTNVGKREFYVKIANGLGPILGGLIIAKFGFSVLFITSIILLLFGGLPILFNVSEWKHGEHNPTDIIENYLLNGKFKKTTIAYFGQGMDALVYEVFWPILLFVVLKNFIAIGSLKSVTMLISIISTLIVGKYLDKHGPKVIHAIGAFINGTLYLPRIFLTTPLALYVIDTADRLNAPMFGIPLTTLSYEKAKKSGTSNFMIYREIVIHLSLAITALVGFLTILSLESWKWIFALAAIGSYLTYYITLDKN